MGWLIAIAVVVIVYFVIVTNYKQKMNTEMRDFFAESEIEVPKARGFLRGLGVNPMQEEEVIEECKTSSGKINRNKLLKWSVAFMENQKDGTGRKMLEAAGFRSLSELE